MAFMSKEVVPLSPDGPLSAIFSHSVFGSGFYRCGGSGGGETEGRLGLRVSKVYCTPELVGTWKRPFRDGLPEGGTQLNRQLRARKIAIDRWRARLGC